MSGWKAGDRPVDPRDLRHGGRTRLTGRRNKLLWTAAALVIVAMLLLAAYVSVAHRRAQQVRNDGWLPPPPDAYWPSPERPIILKGGKLIFGGRNGTERNAMKWSAKAISQVVSPGGRLAAAVLALGDRTAVDFVNPERTVVKRIEVAKGERIAKLWIGDRGDMLVGIGPSLAENERTVLISIAENDAVQPRTRDAGPNTDETQWKWVFWDCSGKSTGVDLGGNAVAAFVFGDGRWAALEYNADHGSVILSAWREGQRLWNREIRKQAGDISDYTMVVPRNAPPRIEICAGRECLQFDLDGQPVGRPRQEGYAPELKANSDETKVRVQD